MKLAIYGEKEVNQIVLTPENDWEKHVISDCKDGMKITIHHAGFYRTRGGWDRQGEMEDSLIIRFEEQKPAEKDSKTCKHTIRKKRLVSLVPLKHEMYCEECGTISCEYGEHEQSQAEFDLQNGLKICAKCRFSY